MTKHLFLIVATILLTGCLSTDPAIPFDSGGSRADGVITMSTAPIDLLREVDWEASEHLVLQRCRVWDYNGYLPFTGVRQRCIDSSALLGCLRYVFERDYQCTNVDMLQSLPTINQH